MFGLIRRISYGVIPRSDRPWEEDPTSNAPHRNRKRRLSSTERDVADDTDQAGKKKVRGESATPSVADADATFLTPPPQIDTKEVKEVTQGVKGVDLEEKSTDLPVEGSLIPERVPLPEETAGELDEPLVDGPAEPLLVEEGSNVPDNNAITGPVAKLPSIAPVVPVKPKMPDDDDTKDPKEEMTSLVVEPSEGASEELDK